MPHFIVYSTQVNEQLHYIVDFIFSNILLATFELTNKKEDLNRQESFLINYSDEIIDADLHIIPFGLLFETGIHPQEITISRWNNHPIFFQHGGGSIPFDLFSASFYLLTGYEQYLEYTPDRYQRFPATESLAYKANFLSIPLIDVWIHELRTLIMLQRPDMELRMPKMQYIPTYDIDIAYSYLGKGLKRTLGGLVQDAVKGNGQAVLRRMKVLLGKSEDPYDSYEFLDKLHLDFQLAPIYFFLLSEGGELDKNLAPEGLLMRELIQRLQTKYKTGIHPSYRSHEHIDILRREINTLASKRSRQHYIRFRLPDTFRRLISCGIREDYSMGYGDMNGFRVSTAYPHRWFDLQRNEVTPLQLFPFCYMECNSFFEQHMSADEAITEMKHYANTVKQTGGMLITVWHNFSLGYEPLWTGWKEAYVEFLNHLKKKA